MSIAVILNNILLKELYNLDKVKAEPYETPELSVGHFLSPDPTQPISFWFVCDPTRPIEIWPTSRLNHDTPVPDPTHWNKKILDPTRLNVLKARLHLNLKNNQVFSKKDGWKSHRKYLLTYLYVLMFSTQKPSKVHITIVIYY